MAIDWEEKEEDDLEELLRRLKPSFAAILRRFRIPPQDSQDRTQNVLLHYLYKRSQVRNPAAWLRGALRRECLMYLRSCRRSRTVAVDAAILEFLGGSLVPDAERADLRRRLGKWFRKMSYKCRKLLRLRYFEELDAKETAQRTGFKPSSVDKVTRRCVEALARKIASVASAISTRGQQRGKTRGKRDEP
jgi:RNA polymerase sigma factor (sigma-70 family)